MSLHSQADLDGLGGCSPNPFGGDGDVLGVTSVFASAESAGDEQGGVQQSAWLEAGQPKENKRTFLNVGRLGGSGHDWRRRRNEG